MVNDTGGFKRESGIKEETLFVSGFANHERATAV